MWNSLTIPWHFPDGSRHSPVHVKCYSYHGGTSVIVSGGDRNATVHDLKPKGNSEVQRNDTNMQLTINSFRLLFPDKIFSLTSPWLLVKSLIFPQQLSNSLTFPGFPDKCVTQQAMERTSCKNQWRMCYCCKLGIHMDVQLFSDVYIQHSLSYIVQNFRLNWLTSQAAQ